jgi:hypothetical protein
MASQKIKFKMSIEKLAFEFEGDVETGQRIQSEIKKTITNLAHTQERLLPHDPNVIDEVPAAQTNGTKAKKQSRSRRPKANTPRATMVTLRAEGFFDTKRDIGAIQEVLSTRGRNFKSNELSPALVALVQKNILKREKNESGQYEYEKGPNDDVGGSAEETE